MYFSSISTFSFKKVQGQKSRNEMTEEGSKPRGTDNIQGKICEHIFAHNRGYRVQIFCNTSKNCLRKAYCFLRGMFSVEYSLVRLYE